VEEAAYIILALGIVSFVTFLVLPVCSTGGGFISFGDLRGIFILLVLLWGILGNAGQKVVSLFTFALSVSILASPALIHYDLVFFGRVWFTVVSLLGIFAGIFVWWTDESEELSFLFYLAPLSFVLTAIAFYLI
jgi:hypothetical protein